MTEKSPQEARKQAIERAEAYRMLAVIFGEIDLETLSEELSCAAQGPLKDMLAPLEGTLDEDLPYEATRLFAQGVAVSPCETSYGRADKGTVLGQLAALYGLFGARTGGAEAEAPDHICVELEFAAILCIKEAFAIEQGDEEKLAISRRAQEVFLTEHLAAFAPRFVQRLVQSTDLPYFIAAGEVLARWLTRDLEQNGWTPERWAASLPVVANDAEDFEPATCPVAAGGEI